MKIEKNICQQSEWAAREPISTNVTSRVCSAAVRVCGLDGKSVGRFYHASSNNVGKFNRSAWYLEGNRKIAIELINPVTNWLFNPILENTKEAVGCSPYPRSLQKCYPLHRKTYCSGQMDICSWTCYYSLIDVGYSSLSWIKLYIHPVISLVNHDNRSSLREM